MEILIREATLADLENIQKFNIIFSFYSVFRQYLDTGMIMQDLLLIIPQINIIDRICAVEKQSVS